MSLELPGTLGILVHDVMTSEKKKRFNKFQRAFMLLLLVFLIKHTL